MKLCAGFFLEDIYFICNTCLKTNTKMSNATNRYGRKCNDYVIPVGCKNHLYFRVRLLTYCQTSDIYSMHITKSLMTTLFRVAEDIRNHKM